MSEQPGDSTAETGGRRRATRLVAVTALLVGVGATAAGALFATAGHRAAATTLAARSPAGCGSGVPKVTETATGTLSVTPNLLTLTLDVHATGPSAQSALAADDATTTAVLHALHATGVPSDDVQTTDLTIQPDYAATGSTVRGYGVDDSVVAKLRTLLHAGTAIDAAVTAGGSATRIESVSLSVTPPLHAQDRARDLAVHVAVGHATAMAAAAGRRLAGICSIQDAGTTGTTGPLRFPSFAAYGAAAPSAAHVPVEAGTQRITSRVTVVFALR